MSTKRTLEGFFRPTQPKKARVESSEEASTHATYPFPVSQFPPSLKDSLGFCPAREGRVINEQPDLDLLYFEPYITKRIERELFEFLRQELFFYRVQYKIKRGLVETQINTPRFTTVFGVDETSYFAPDGSLMDSKTKTPIPKDRYKCRPRPLPACLDLLRKITEGSTVETYNFCLINYYASGDDSISYHSDDERFLGPNPAIASFSLGAKRDFLMKHKPKSGFETQSATKPLKLSLASGDMILMRGPTQSNWLHSIPKRKGTGSEKGRINITFRKAIVKYGTENYYQYNVGAGGVYKWDPNREEMVTWKEEAM
ncbi:2OG-Fe(II) oxygenase superfamily protein [Patellaria atrata CBS 101060]|uniref:2OG-Fe(II) oxygenase superfamily protein n=1 Tax=Patellaria atrata CBS 101060 TaxID=1346257 RepID=A0A9P4S5I5_9PEZI|nr:2OG-Fe(II) oxygenase superfamily protein [Patellaria atrata CBS 101060]